MTNSLLQKLQLHFTIPLLIFIALLARNPFSERTLIPNFEPFPDSFHYVLPARCFISMNQWNLCRPTTPGRNSDVAPLYSVVLIPFYLISLDPRMFYFANLALAITSFVLLHLILKKSKIRQLIIFAVLLLTATSYHFYWYPTLAMAENLIIFLFLLSIWLLFTKHWLLKILGIFVALSFYGTKYAFAPLTVVFLGLHGISMWQYRKKLPPRLLYVGAAIAIIGLVVLLQSRSALSLFTSKFFALTLTEQELQKTWFSLAYIPWHLPKYLGSLVGQPTLVLWDTRPLLPWFFSLIGMGGLLWGVIVKKYRLLSATILISILFQFLFISTFYAYDSRYTIHVLYGLLIGLGIGLNLIVETVPKYKKLLLLIITSATLLYLFALTPVLRKQLAINLKYAETPWYYVATKHIDGVVSQSQTDTVLAAAFPVYFFDFFAKGTYTVLPVSVEQERSEKPVVYGTQYTYDDLPALYEELLQQGKTVYLSNYGLGNQGYMHEAYAAITERMNADLISEGCHGACNVYKLRLKETK